MNDKICYFIRLDVWTPSYVPLRSKETITSNMDTFLKEYMVGIPKICVISRRIEHFGLDLLGIWAPYRA
jgi:hypothetical protein